LLQKPFAKVEVLRQTFATLRGPESGPLCVAIGSHELRDKIDVGLFFTPE